MKKLFCLLLLTPILFLTSCNGSSNADIITTNFAAYDIARNIAGDKLKCEMLLNPGQELHGYSPSISDMESVYSSRMFIYIGGESDSSFVEGSILKNISKDTIVINMIDEVKTNGSLYEEEDPSSAKKETEDESEEEVEYDEHIWTSIKNEMILTEAIYEKIVKLDSDNKSFYEENKNNFISELERIDNEISDVVSNAKTNLLIFADRFPLLYFVKEYNLEYDAAFKGCDTSKDASVTTIEALTKKVEDNNIKVIFTIELSESNIATTIINNCKNDGYIVKNLTFYTMHNVSKEDYESGLTYIDFFEKNITSLKEALN